MGELQGKINYIIEIADLMDNSYNNETYLFEKINELSKENINELANVYEHNIFTNNKVSPVNLIRHKLLSLLKEGKQVDSNIIDELKEKFTSKDLEVYSEYPKSILDSIQNYEISKPFNSWKEYFRILYTFLFRGEIKEKVNLYLESIDKYIKKNINNKDLISHFVNFDGSQNFGSTSCWMVFFPKFKINHKNSIQLGLYIDKNGIRYNKHVGDELKRIIKKSIDIDINDYEIDFGAINNIDEIISDFNRELPSIIEENKKFKQFWKFAPGEQAKYWDEMKKENIIAIGWDEIGDINNYTNMEQYPDSLTLREKNILDYFKNAPIGDIVIANKGMKKAVGIGIITGKYEYRKERSYYKKVRNVEWVIDKEITFKNSVFPIPTFYHTNKYIKIKKEYLKQYPELKEKFDEIEKGLIIDASQDKEIDKEPALSTKSNIDDNLSEEKNYYWLNANPKIWRYTDIQIGGKETYSAYNNRDNKRKIYNNFIEANPGDIVIGYSTSPIKKIEAICEITKPLYTDELEGEIIEFEIKEILENPIAFELLKNNKDLINSQMITSNLQGSLFKLTEMEFNTISNIIEEFNATSKTKKQAIQKYSLEEALNDSGFVEEEFNKLINLLKTKKQIILQGPPGTGKTHLAKIISKRITNSKDNIEIIQFHSSYSYEDFVEGYRPSEDGKFILKDGIFKDLCRKANINKAQKYVLIIDEINRGEISKIFGELLYLLEYRDSKIRLTYSPELDFQIPKNIYIIGTMNLADRSLALIDYALRRRFSFMTLETDYDIIKRLNTNAEIDINIIIKNIKEINDTITKNHSLGKDFTIGHSYFINKNNDKIKNKTSIDYIWKFEIEPLLSEYFYDEKEEVERLGEIFSRDVL